MEGDAEPRRVQRLAQGGRPTRASITTCGHRPPAAGRSRSKTPRAGTPHAHTPGRTLLSAAPAARAQQVLGLRRPRPRSGPFQGLPQIPSPRSLRFYLQPRGAPDASGPEQPQHLDQAGRSRVSPKPPNKHLKLPELAAPRLLATSLPLPPPARSLNPPGHRSRRVALPLPVPGRRPLGPKDRRVLRDCGSSCRNGWKGVPSSPQLWAHHLTTFPKRKRQLSLLSLLS